MKQTPPILSIIHSAISRALPKYAHWTIGESPVEYHFDPTTIRSFSKKDITGEPEAEWLNLLIFGSYNVADGGGAQPYLTVHQITGRVYGLDVENSDPIFLLNSSIEQFIQTFVLLDHFLAKNLDLPPEIENTVRTIDQEAYGSSWEWLSLIQEARQGRHGSH